MIKSLNNNDIIVTPFITNKEWETDNSNPDLILWMSQSNGQLLTGSIACTYIDYGDNSPQYPITNSYCTLLTQQQDNVDINYINIQKGVYNPNIIYPISNFKQNTELEQEPDRNKINIDGTYTDVVYATTQHLFYNNYNNFTKTFGLETADESKIIKNLTYEMDILNIPINNFGETIVPKTLKIKDYVLGNDNLIIDDGNCNLIISGSIFSRYCINDLLYSNVNSINLKIKSFDCNNSVSEDYTSMLLIPKGAGYYFVSSSRISTSIDGGIAPFNYFWYVGGTYKDLWKIVPNNNTAILEYKSIVKSINEVYYNDTFAVCQVIDSNNNNLFSNFIYLINCPSSSNTLPTLPNTSSKKNVNLVLGGDLLDKYNQSEIIDLIDNSSIDSNSDFVYTELSSEQYHPNIKLTTYEVRSPRSTKAYVTEINLSGSIKIKLTPSSSVTGINDVNKNTVLQSPNSFTGNNFGLLGVNLNPFNTIDNKNADLIGLYVSSSVLISKFTNQPAFGVDRSYAILGYAPAINIDINKTASIVTCNRNSDGSSINEAVSLYNAFAGSAQVITNGQITIPTYFTGPPNEYVYGSQYLNPINGYNNSNSWYDLPISRNIIGINSDGTKLYIAVTENVERIEYFGNNNINQRSVSGQKGMKARDLAKILIDNHQVYNAISMDSEDSTGLVIRGPKYDQSIGVGKREIFNVNIPDNSTKVFNTTKEWRTKSVGCNITFLDQSVIYNSGFGSRELCANGTSIPYGIWQFRHRYAISSSNTTMLNFPNQYYEIKEQILSSTSPCAIKLIAASSPEILSYTEYVLRNH